MISVAYVVCITFGMTLSNGMKFDIKRTISTKSFTKQFGTVLAVSTLLLNPINTPVALATSLGDHTVCAYPACTSQQDILLNTAPNLASKAEKELLYDTLTTIGKVMKTYPSDIENGEFLNVRSGFRSMPVSQLRITCRKIKIFLPEQQKQLFTRAYGNSLFDANIFYID